MTRARRAQILITLGLLAVLAVVLAIALGGGGDEKSTVITPTATEPGGTGPALDQLFADVPADGMTIGNGDAPELEEFIDPQCPFCAQFAANVVPTLVSDYVESGRIRLTLRPLAFLGDDSVPAARAVAAAGLQDKAWPFMETFFANQREENSGYVTDEFLRTVGAQVEGLDVDAMMAAMDGGEVKAVLDAAASRAEQVGANSTPSFRLTKGADEPQEVPSELEQGPFLQGLDAALSGG